jgi:hypothetical protein
MALLSESSAAAPDWLPEKRETHKRRSPPRDLRRSSSTAYCIRRSAGRKRADREEGELVEVTPKNIRLRKILLKAHDRRRVAGQAVS